MQRILGFCLLLTIIVIGPADSTRSAYATPTTEEPGKYISMPSEPWIPNVAHPDLAQGPIVESVQDGAWSDATTWGGPLPGAADVVVVHHKVIFDTQTEVYDLAVYPNGRLAFRTDMDTSLTVGTLQVLYGGCTGSWHREQPHPS